MNQNIKNLAKNNAFIAFIYLDATLLSDQIIEQVYLKMMWNQFNNLEINIKFFNS